MELNLEQDAHGRNVFNKGKILLIEDERAVGSVIQILLNHWGYASLAAGSPGAAKQIWQEEKGTITQVIIDLHFGNNNGLELARTFRNEKPNLKVIITTDSLTDEFCRSLYFEDFQYLPKPFKAERLKKLIA